MKTTTLMGALAAPVLCLWMSVPAFAADAAGGQTMCKDGTTSATSGRGACSGHGGVQKAPKASKASKSKAETKSEAPAAAPAAAPALAAKSEAPAAKSAAKSTPAASKSAPAGSDAGAPAGATAKCKDGTYSKSSKHTGSCSHHGGVAEWLDGK